MRVRELSAARTAARDVGSISDTLHSVRDFINRGREQWALIQRADGQQNTALALFIHGFRGNYLATWGKIPELLTQKADDDPDFLGWDFLFLGYNTRDVACYLDLAGLIGSAWRKAASGEAPYGQKYQRLALFGHSLGTLGIRQALCATAAHGGPLLAALHSVTLFGTPLNGSPAAAVGALFYPIADALKPGNPQLRMLRVWSEGSFSTSPWINVRVVAGQGDWVVGSQLNELVQWPGDLNADQTVLNHSDLVKADAWDNCSVMDYLRTGLR